MSNYILKPEDKRIANITSLTVTESCEYYASREASKMIGRFIQTASLLPKNGFLGWQMTIDKGGKVHAFAFSSQDVKITSKDFSWIFQNCAAAETKETDSFEDLHADFCRVYALHYTPGVSDEIQSFGDEYLSSETYFRDLVGAMKESGAAIRMVTETGHAGQGMITIGLAEEMTLKMRMLLSLAFPDTVAVEADKTAGNTDFRLPEKYLMESMMQLLEIFIIHETSNYSSCDDADDFEADDSYCDDIDTLPDDTDKDVKDADRDAEHDDLTIDELALSVRSFNCLKRARINTVGEIRKMSRDDLMKVRNLGRKGREEIIQKLASMGLTLKGEQELPDSSALLRELIGLKDVKEQVKKISAFARMKKEMEALGKASVPMALNMEFVGNPGTAKTTVARILAGIFKEIGILSSGEIVETGRADLVKGYIGQTAINVKSVFEKAKGKLLFIDEAYSLISDGRDFGCEAVDTIVQEMENNREDTVVVFAGYPDKMESFFSMNPGLRSRVPFRISFPDYSVDEMTQIVRLEAEKRGFSICPQALEKAASLCKEVKQRSDTGNGRFCRNLVENAILSYALRVYGEEMEGVEKDFVLADEDFTLPNNIQAIPVTQEVQKAPIGFCR